MKAKYLVKTSYPVAEPVEGTDSVRDKILGTGYLVVMEGDHYVGILTSQDFFKSPRNLVLDCLQEKPLVDFEQSVDSILSLMKESGFDALPVKKDGIFKGVVLQSDILDFLNDYNRELQDQIRNRTKELTEINIRLKEEIRNRQSAEKQNRELTERIHHSEKVAAIGTLAAGIAHDFNNILSPIIGFSEMAMEDVSSGSPLWQNLNEIYMAGNRAKEVVKQILRYARQSECVAEPVKIKTVMNDGLKLIQSSFPASIAIEQIVETEACVKADATMIHQIYMNLCTNACQAMAGTGGRLGVHAKETLFLTDSEYIPEGITPGEYVEISFSDDGIGILPGNLPRVFDPYFTTKPAGQGTGLGLSTVYGIVKGYNGAIHIESRPGRGTTVFVYLPVTHREQVKPEDRRINIRKGHENILFVDDEEAIVRLNQHGLERAGYRVSVNRDPLQALALFQSEPDAFDLVITDMTMPHMSGDVFAHELKRVRPDIPVILCTGYNPLYSEAKMMEIGLDAVLDKPVLFSDLSETIRNILDRNRCRPMENPDM